jgi:hypothetical protein
VRRYLISLAVLLAPVLAFAVPNPLRAYAPALFGLHCDAQRLCVDDPSRFQSARNLAALAQDDLLPCLGPAQAPPRLIFCATQSCYDIFGRRRSTAVSFGESAVLIGPRGWQAHYVKHELVHIAQYRNLGLIRTWRLPEWLREGMAYSLSADPRRPLPGELEPWRKQFETWYAADRKRGLWERLHEFPGLL